MGNFVTESLLVSDLRDSEGNKLRVIKITEVNGTYQNGGIPIDPADVGLSSIKWFSVQSLVCFPSGGENDPWTAFCMVSPIIINDEWRMAVYLRQEDGTYEELSDGTPLTLLPGFSISALVIGSDPV